jgi:hypothetical protein
MGKLNMQNMRHNHLRKDGLISQVDHRGIHCAAPGRKLIIADLAQIEPRFLNYCAGNKEFLELCKTVSVYEAAAIASGAWAKNKGTLKKNDPVLYALTKAQCIAGCTPVLTDRGYMTAREIAEKKLNIRVWDGVSFVATGGAVRTGDREVIEYEGEYFTEDHQIFTGERTTEQAGSVCSGAYTGELLGRNPPGGAWADVWQLGSFVIRSLANEWRVVCKDKVSHLWQRVRDML